MTSYWWYYVLARSLAATYGPGVTHVHNLGAVCIGECRSQMLGSVMIGLGAKAEFIGAIGPEIAGLSMDRGAEPMRLLPFSGLSTDQSKVNNLGAVAPALAHALELGAVCPEIAGISTDRGIEPMRLLPFSGLSTDQSITHNLGAVMIGKGAKAVLIGAVCPEIAGLSKDRCAEPMRYLPFGSVTTGEGGD